MPEPGDVESFNWPQWVAHGRKLGMSPREVFDLPPASFLNLIDNSIPQNQRIMSRRQMLTLMREVDGRP